jgi:hypothetical protein
MPDENLTFADHAWETRGGGKLLLYFGPHLKQSLAPAAVAAYVRQKRAWGAFWNYGLGEAGGGPWYSYICDTPGYELEKLESKNSRKTIRQSLQRCAVRKVDLEWLADHGYETYQKATSRFKNFRVATRAEFSAELRTLAGSPGMFAYGVFVGETLVAYGLAREWRPCVRFLIAHFDPAFSHEKPMYALYYTLAHEYLNHGFSEIDAGWRPLQHETDIEEFFRRMGWRFVPCRIGLYLRWPLKILAGLGRACPWLLRRLPGRPRTMLQGLLVAQELAVQSAQWPAETTTAPPPAHAPAGAVNGCAPAPKSPAA